MLEDVPDQHLVEEVRLVARGRELWRDADLGARVGPDGRLLADLDAVNLEAAIGQRTQHHTATAADVEHPGARRQRAREEGDVPLAHPAHETLDLGLELRAGLAIVFVRVEAAHFLQVGQGIETAEPAVGAHHDDRRGASDLEAGPGLAAPAHGTRRQAQRGMFVRADPPNGVLVELSGAQGPASRARWSDASCGSGWQRSRLGLSGCAVLPVASRAT